ncbi:MAG: pantoate--beta-alanine ligase, partial [Sedimentisphaerales bacterium]|nr:pantoate--beta-alanine ligase [Sedimentisphaerales bacterium]
VADLNMPLEIVVCPIVREANGLAMSSRNKYLNAQQRQDAAAIYASLRKSEQMIKSGERDSAAIITTMQEMVQRSGLIATEYIHIVDAATLTDLQVVKGQVLIAVAAKIDTTRLIDNILIDASV